MAIWSFRFTTFFATDLMFNPSPTLADHYLKIDRTLKNSPMQAKKLFLGPIFKNLTVFNQRTPLPPKFGDDVWLHEYQAAAMQCCIKKMLLHKKWNFHSNYLDDAELCVLMSFTHKVFLCLIILCQSSCWGVKKSPASQHQLSSSHLVFSKYSGNSEVNP